MQWVIEQRLPLFLTSDLYSEYKLCKLLTSSARPFIHKLLKNSQLRQRKASMSVSQRGQGQRFISEENEQGKGEERQDSSVASRTTSAGRMVGFALPHMSAQNTKNFSLERQAVRPPQTPVTEEALVSKFDWPSTFKRSRVSSAKSMSSHAGDIGVLRPPFRRSHSVSLSTRPSTSSSIHSTNTELAMLFSKSGMGLFRKFLQNKPGERNLLFWLDVEQVKYLDSPGEMQK